MIEMIVTISIFALLVALGVPAMRSWVANTKVRAVADALQNGLRMAQTESLRRSRQVVFALTNTANPQLGFTAVNNGNSATYWAVQTVPAVTGEVGQVIQTGVLMSAGSTININGPSAVCFNSVGRLVANAAPGPTNATCTTPPTVNNIPMFVYQVTLTGGAPMSVELGLGGHLHLCDPNQTLSSTNPYGC